MVDNLRNTEVKALIDVAFSDGPYNVESKIKEHRDAALPIVLDRLKALKASEDTSALRTAVTLLKMIGSDDCVDDLLPLLGHDNNYVVCATIDTLAVLGNDKAIAPLTELIESRSTPIATSAIDALVALAERLIEKEVIDTEELKEIVETSSPSPMIVPGTGDVALSLALAAEYGADYYRDYEALLLTDLDAVSIGLPDRLHHQV